MRTFTSFFIVLLFSIFSSALSAQTDILNWSGTVFQQISPGNVYMQNFTMPAGDDYYITQIGINIGSQSDDGSVIFGVCDETNNLVYKTKEVTFTGGEEKVVYTDVEPGMQKLLASKDYSVAVIYSNSGSGYLYIQAPESNTNEGIATVATGAKFKTNINYPIIPDPLSSQSGYALSLGFILKGETITSEIEPKDEILDFNCNNVQVVGSGNIYSAFISMPAGESKEVRQIGMKMVEYTAGGQLKFAVFDEDRKLLYITEEITATGEADTIHASIPAGTVTLEAEKDYYISMQHNGSNYLKIEIEINPVSKGIAAIDRYTKFTTEPTYPIFPDSLTIKGQWAHALGFVLNGDDPSIPTKTDRKQSANNSELKLFPTVADDFIWLYAEGVNQVEVPVSIYSINGTLVKELILNGSEKKNLDVSNLPAGAYIVKTELEEGGYTTKFIKR